MFKHALSVRVVSIAAVTTALAATTAQAQTSNWTADRTLRVEFRMPSAAWPLQPNTMTLAAGYVNITQPFSVLTMKLYNGSTLMGTAQGLSGSGHVGQYSFHPLASSFQAADSSFLLYRSTPAIIDFSPLLNRTIQGRIDVNIDRGAIQLNTAAMYMMLMEYIPGRIYGQSIYPQPVITSVKLIPELPTDQPPTPVVEPGLPVLGPSNNATISAATLKAYCDQAKGTAVLFHNHVTITPSSTEVSVATGCTIEVKPNVLFTVEGAMLKFGGPLTIQSQGQGGLKLLRSRITAPGIAITYPGADSKITSSESTLRADGGALTVALGDDGAIVMYRRHSTQADALWSTGQVTIGAGKKLVAGLLGASVRGNQGILIRAAGDEASIKSVDGVVLNAPQGAVKIESTGSKGMVEMSDTQIQFQDSLALSLAGTDSTIKLNKATIGPVSGTATGGVVLETGTGGASLGAVEGAEVTLRGVRSAVIRGAANGLGSVKWEKGTGNVGGNILLQGGGVTEVKDNSFTSPTLIRIFTPGGRSCNGSANSLSAPVVEICPAF